MGKQMKIQYTNNLQLANKNLSKSTENSNDTLSINEKELEIFGDLGIDAGEKKPLVLTLPPLADSASARPPVQNEPVAGDVNQDGLISYDDILMFRFFLPVSTVPISEQFNLPVEFTQAEIAAADMNGDGKVTYEDQGPLVELLKSKETEQNYKDAYVPGSELKGDFNGDSKVTLVDFEIMRSLKNGSLNYLYKELDKEIFKTPEHSRGLSGGDTWKQDIVAAAMLIAHGAKSETPYKLMHALFEHFTGIEGDGKREESLEKVMKARADIDKDGKFTENDLVSAWERPTLADKITENDYYSVEKAAEEYIAKNKSRLGL